VHVERLKLYCDLIETQSFTKAAQLNEVSQSAVSQAVSALEQFFGARMLERSKNHVRLTPAGEVLFDYSKRLVQSFEKLHNQLQEAGGTVAGKVRLATTCSIGLHILPPFLKKFRKLHPAVSVQLEYSHAGQVYSAVLRGTADVGMVAYPSRDARLEIVPVRKDPLVLICSPHHPLARTEPVRFKTLKGQAFVQLQRDLPTRKGVDKILEDHGASVVTALELDNLELVKRAVAIGAGVAIVPLTTVKRERANRTLAALRLEGGDYFRPLALLYLKGQVLGPALERLISVLKQPV